MFFFFQNNSVSDSDASCESQSNNNNLFWEAYESNIYRKTHINEKAFANTIGNQDNRIKEKQINKAYENTTRKPDTPPADYDLNTTPSSDLNKTKRQNTSYTAY